MGDSTVALPIAFALGSGLTFLAVRVAVRLRLARAPDGQRWTSRPVSTIGGLALAATIGLVLVVLRPDDGLTSPVWLVIGASVIFVVGFVDDNRPIDPRIKLAMQLAVALAIALAGYQIEALPSPASIVLSTLWIVGVMNAINLIDNMDGISASTVATITTGLAVISLSVSGIGVVTLLTIAGASLGFLTANWPPARIYMGDAGTLLLGTLLAALSLNVASSVTTSPAVSIAVLGLLAVPIFDTIFVFINRMRRGDSPLNGGKDHTSHLLVVRGWPHQVVIGAFVLMTAVAAAGGYVAVHAGIGPAAPIFVALAVVFVITFTTLSPAALNTTHTSGVAPGIGT